MKDLKWTRKTTEKIAQELKSLDIDVSPNTVGRLLKKMKYSLKVNHKKKASGIKNPPNPADRDKQFGYIADLREKFAKEGNPTISVDTKKRNRSVILKTMGHPGSKMLFWLTITIFYQMP